MNSTDVVVGTVVVVGTLNLDIVVRVDRMPDVGETVLGLDRAERPGGKGANQAAAAARIAPTALIGAVGDDPAAETLVANQVAAGVQMDHLHRATGISGQAIIEVDAHGDNRIIVLSGANASLTADDVQRGLDAISPRIVLTQLESPRAVTEAAAAWCRRTRRRFLLNPSPVADLDDSIIALADPLVVNEHEAAYYAPDAAADPESLARQLLRMSRSAVITLGGDGIVVAADDTVHKLDVDRVDVVDTTGAGDLFAGTLAGHLAHGVAMRDACELAARAATEFVARPRDRGQPD